MMLNTFDRKAKTFGNLMVSQKLNRGNGSTHVQSGLTHRKRTIWIATRDTTESSCLAQCPDGANHGSLNHGLRSETPQRRKPPLNLLKTIAHIEEEDPDKDGTNIEDYDMQDWSFWTHQPPSYDQVHVPESLWQLYYMEA